MTFITRILLIFEKKVVSKKIEKKGIERNLKKIKKKTVLKKLKKIKKEI